MKIELLAGETWKDETIFVVSTDLLSRYMCKDGFFYNGIDYGPHAQCKGRVVEIESLNNEYCALKVADWGEIEKKDNL